MTRGKNITFQGCFEKKNSLANMKYSTVLYNSNLVCGFVPVGRDLLHDEFHHLPGVVPSLADKTPEASAVFQQYAAAFSQHLVRKIQCVICLNLTFIMSRRLRAAYVQFPLIIKGIQFS